MSRREQQATNPMAGSTYNATVYDSVNGQRFGCFVAQVDTEGKMLRSNWVQCTQFDGTPLYHEYLQLLHPTHTFEIVQDNCQGYVDRIRALALPPAYRV